MTTGKTIALTIQTFVSKVKSLLFNMLSRFVRAFLKKAEHQRTDAFELWCYRRLWIQSPLDSREIKPVNPKGNQSWIFIARTDAEAETEVPILWPPDVKSWRAGQDPDAGKDRRQEEKGTTEDEIVGWHHRFNGHEFEQTQGDSEGQGSLACCCPCGHRESDRTEWLNNNDKSTKGCKIKMKILCLSLWRKTETRTKETGRYFWKY